MGIGTWKVDPDTRSVYLVDSSSQRVSVDAMDIWSAEFEGLAEIQNVSVTRPSAELTYLEFSPELAQIALQLRQDAASRSAVVAVVRSAPDDEAFMELPHGDQVVHNGRWYFIDSAETEAAEAALRQHGVALGAELTEENLLWLLWSSGLEIQESSALLPAISRSRSKIESVDGLVNAELYPYQRDGVKKLITLYNQGLGCLLSDEMGLGKTLQVIALIVFSSRRGPSLVVCPASTLSNWSREIQRFTEDIRVHIHRGPLRTGNPAQLQTPDVVLTSYETFTRDLYLFRSVNWNIAALDEAQNIKNHSSKRAQSVKSLNTTSSIAISGTPIENSLRDMWSLMEFVAPTYLPDLNSFESAYPDENWAALELGKRVAPLVIRRRVSQVAQDLPERIDSYVPVPMSEAFAKTYNHERQSNDSPLARISALRLIAASSEDAEINMKLTQLTLICAEAFQTEKKIIVFSSYTRSIDGLANYARNAFRGTFTTVIDGRTSMDSRQDILDAFAEYEGSAILILNPKAAGVGLNIQAANYVVHFTPEWNPAVVDQASARAYRRGQKLPVFIYYLYYEDSVEEVMVDRLETKRTLQEHGMHGAADTPTQDEIRRILESGPEGGVYG